MKYGYDIKDNEGCLWGDSGDMLFDTKDEAMKDAESFIPDMIKTELLNGYDIAGKLHIELWETNFAGMEVC